ncbi:MBOAT family O-acyltransferase [Moraxella oblonga]|uniref:MBOAT family O-acyltransferase n=1 Tax=Moraxella oblonga TaxID=200413 RepID=UPI00082B061B|nr:MBOAT family O-acyltransferase [Moraxella oblonga]
MFSFLSVEFALLFVVFFVVYWAFYQKTNIQNLILLITSYLMIGLMASFLASLILLVFSVAIAFCAINMQRYKNKKKWLWVGIGITLVNLSIFKYYDFFRSVISTSMEMLHLDSSGILANIIFPLGISYYSFQAISYLVSLYNQQKNPNISPMPIFTPIQLLTYLSFFPTITSGPIARVNDTKGLYDIQGNPCGMYAQIVTTTPRQIIMPKLAFALILLALAKKWWLATYLSDNWVNPVFSNPTGFHSLEVLTAIYGYTLQLFLDFSGYSEMVVGIAMLLGFRLPMNFNAPLIAHNIRDFWDRWHISLSTWIRDYIYIPLGGNRLGFWRTQVNLLIAMMLSGIWHGSTLNFLFWGLLHGGAIFLLNIGDVFCQRRFEHETGRNYLAQTGVIGKVIGTVITINFVALAFVLFRATTFEETVLIFKALLFNSNAIVWHNNPYYLLSLLLVCWILYPFVRKYTKQGATIIHKIPEAVVYMALFVGFVLVAILAPAGIPSFIYANF